MKEKKNPHPRKHLTDQPSWQDLKVTEKSTPAGLRTAKQSESCTGQPHSVSLDATA